MIPKKTIEELILRHSTLEKDLSSGEIDKKLFAEKSKEYSDVNEIIENARKYLSYEDDKKDLEKILNDNSADKELKDMAELELSDLKTEFEMNEKKLSNTLSNAELMTKNLAKLSDTLVNANLGETVKSLDATLMSLNSILAGLESGQGTMGKLLTDEEMYLNLTNASKELEELLREMKLHPKRFVHISVFGKKDKGYKPEEGQEMNPEIIKEK